MAIVPHIGSFASLFYLTKSQALKLIDKLKPTAHAKEAYISPITYRRFIISGIKGGHVKIEPTRPP